MLHDPASVHAVRARRVRDIGAKDVDHPRVEARDGRVEIQTVVDGVVGVVEQAGVEGVRVQALVVEQVRKVVNVA